jgi:glycerol dehydrogenase-like iron-containing ADH family enzyme
MLTIKTPVSYINKPDIIDSAGDYIKKYGKKAFILGSKTPLKVVGNGFFSSLDNNQIEYIISEFNGFPTLEKAQSYAKIAEEFGADHIIAIGGGKVNDTSKVVGSLLKLPVIAIPTIAATCASWASVSILYDEEGSFKQAYWNDNSPVLILADTRIIATAPARFINAGIVDTLAKWYETVPNLKIAKEDITLNISVNGAKIAFDLLKEQGQKAVEDGQKQVITKEVMDTVDAIIYLAGFVGSFTGEEFYGGFAHPFYNASTRLPNTRFRLHGEKVSFGLLVQQVLENKPESEVIETIKDFSRYNLALTLKDIGIDERKEEDVNVIAESIIKEFSGFNKLGIGLNVKEIEDSIFKTDALVKEVLKLID